ncbi:regulator [Vibrio fluvialis]
MKYHEMTKNYIFREFECGLTREQTAELCFKSVRSVKDWDEGKPIPRECRRLMRLHSNKDLSISSEWEGFSLTRGKLILPTGSELTPQQIILASALLEIGADSELIVSTKILKYVRALIKIKSL